MYQHPGYHFNPYNFNIHERYPNPFAGHSWRHEVYLAEQRQKENEAKWQRQHEDRLLLLQKRKATVFAKMCLYIGETITLGEKPISLPITRNIKILIAAFIGKTGCHPNRTLYGQIHFDRRSPYAATCWFTQPHLRSLCERSSPEERKLALKPWLYNTEHTRRMLLEPSLQTQMDADFLNSALPGPTGYDTKKTIRYYISEHSPQSHYKWDEALFDFKVRLQSTVDSYRKLKRAGSAQRLEQLDTLQDEVKDICRDSINTYTKLLQIKDTIRITRRLILRSHLRRDRGWFIDFFLALFARLGITRSRLERNLDRLGQRLTVATQMGQERTAPPRPRMYG